jgi:hypothetical protein
MRFDSCKLQFWSKAMYKLKTISVGSYVIMAAFNDAGQYIGTEEFAKDLYDRGIIPEYIDETRSVCSVGFCASDQKWYGWSRRAICGFGVGDTISEDDLAIGDKTPIGFTAKTLDDARSMAIAFAAGVS